MGAALLSNPTHSVKSSRALREFLPPHIPLSAKIRLLPTQEETLDLVGKIIETGISALTVHCRTRSMRKSEPALPHRLREIVEFVEASGKNIAVIENGDCLGYEDAQRIRALTGNSCFAKPPTCSKFANFALGAHSVMVASAAETNPSCFLPSPLTDVEETLIPPYLRMVRVLRCAFRS